MAFELAAVTAYVAALSITGKDTAGANKTLTINDYSGAKNAADVRQITLRPDITRQVEIASVTRDSFGAAQQTLSYTVPYVLLYAPAGADRGLEKVIPNMVATLSAIVTAVLANHNPGSGAVDMVIGGMRFGNTMVTDPSGQVFHGAEIDLAVTEFTEV